MATVIPNLWSDDIKVDVVTPLAILRVQAGLLRQKTRGLLEAEVTTLESSSGKVQHQFDLIAPVLDGYRHRILTATHEREMVYPVVIEAEYFEAQYYKENYPDEVRGLSRSLKKAADAVAGISDWRPRASTEQEFIDLVGKALHSGQVRSVIQSLIARSNEKRSSETPPLPEEEDENPSSG